MIWFRGIDWWWEGEPYGVGLPREGYMGVVGRRVLLLEFLTQSLVRWSS